MGEVICNDCGKTNGYIKAWRQEKPSKKYTPHEVSSDSDKETVQVSDITPAKQYK